MTIAIIYNNMIRVETKNISQIINGLNSTIEEIFKLGHKGELSAVFKRPIPSKNKK